MAISTIGTDALASASVTSAKLASGAPSTSQLPAGTVLQVVSTFKNDYNTTTATSFVDISGMSATITPTSATSKVFIIMTCGASGMSSGSTLFNIVRNGTAIAQPAVSTYATCTLNYFQASNSGAFPITLSYLDSPATTSATTYKIQWRVDGASTAYFNRHQSNTDYTAVASFTLMEIAA